jgi:CRISPR/Cas system CSM-associated protein Csm2 small subunit
MRTIDILETEIKESQIRGEKITKDLEEVCDALDKLNENAKISDESLQRIDSYITEIENTIKAKQEITNSLKNIISSNEKATGRTTKLADYYIQELFNNPNKEIEITDHTDTQQSNVHLTQIILRRVYEEHRGVKIKLISPNILKYVQR